MNVKRMSVPSSIVIGGRVHVQLLCRAGSSGASTPCVQLALELIRVRSLCDSPEVVLQP